MKVHVKAFATFREVMDNQVDLEFTEGATLRTLLADLTGQIRRVRRTDVRHSGYPPGLCQHSQERQECPFSVRAGHPARRRGHNRVVSANSRGVGIFCLTPGRISDKRKCGGLHASMKIYLKLSA